jgi:hypothetical protein
MRRIGVLLLGDENDPILKPLLQKGERVRDKIAASKRKGLWVGGPIPLGYATVKKKLVIVLEEAETGSVARDRGGMNIGDRSSRTRGHACCRNRAKIRTSDADPVDGDGNTDRGLHGGEAVSDQRPLGHQAESKVVRRG